MVKLFLSIVSLIFLISCKDKDLRAEAYADLETIVAYPSAATEAEVVVGLLNVKGTIDEYGIEWSIKPLNEGGGKIESSFNQRQSLNGVFTLKGLQPNLTYNVRSFAIINGIKVIGNPLIFKQEFENKWIKRKTFQLDVGEYISTGDAFYSPLINALSMQVVNRNRANYRDIIYYDEADYWTSFSTTRIYLGPQYRHNLMVIPFSPGTEAILTGGGHYVGERSQRIFLKDFTIQGIDGYKWLPLYPGDDVETACFGINDKAYAVEDNEKGIIWQFAFSDKVQWTNIGNIPHAQNTTIRALALDNMALLMVESSKNSPNLLYSFDPVSKQVKKIGMFEGEVRSKACFFRKGNRVFYGLGQSNINQQGLRDIWEYEIESNKWTKIAQYPGIGTRDIVSVFDGKKAFMGFGQRIRVKSDDTETLSDCNDFWEFKP